jgi:hypothetical protein
MAYPLESLAPSLSPSVSTIHVVHVLVGLPKMPAALDARACSCTDDDSLLLLVMKLTIPNSWPTGYELYSPS